MKKNFKNKKAYSIVVIIVIIWFLTVLTTWVFKLVMNEMKDNRTIWSYIKAYAWAESAQELALLEIKEKGYESDKEMDEKNISNFSDVTTKNNKDVYISYKKPNFKVQELNDKTLWAWETVLIPLYYLDSWNSYSEQKITDLKISPNDPNISWNIIWKTSWISWAWDKFSDFKWNVKIYEEKWSWSDKTYEFKLEEKKVNVFLASSEQNYLQMVNWWDSEFKYNINTNNSWWKFVNPITKIISTWESGDYKTNIETVIDFSKMNDFSKYSIFSP